MGRCLQNFWSELLISHDWAPVAMSALNLSYFCSDVYATSLANLLSDIFRWFIGKGCIGSALTICKYLCRGIILQVKPLTIIDATKMGLIDHKEWCLSDSMYTSKARFEQESL